MQIMSYLSVMKLFVMPPREIRLTRNSPLPLSTQHPSLSLSSRLSIPLPIGLVWYDHRIVRLSLPDLHSVRDVA